MTADEIREAIEALAAAETPAEDRITDLLDIGSCVDRALAQWPHRCMCAECSKGIEDLYDAARHPTLPWGKLCAECAKGSEGQ